jgi:hypothetical protein
MFDYHSHHFLKKPVMNFVGVIVMLLSYSPILAPVTDSHVKPAATICETKDCFGIPNKVN